MIIKHVAESMIIKWAQEDGSMVKTYFIIHLSIVA
jgi:hypothetical protein